MSEPKERQPIWGLVGMVLVVLGIIVSVAGAGWGYALIVVGGLVLVVALFTGNVKLFG